MSVSFLEREGFPSLAYQFRPSLKPMAPTILFLPGFASDMEGTKAVFLDSFCEQEGLGCLRFDYSGHGKSGGDFKLGSIGAWINDSLSVLDNLSQGPVVLVGSSMGGWIGFWVTIKRPDRIKAFVGIAAAPDFTREIPDEMNEDQKREMREKGYFALPNDSGDYPYVITRHLLEEGEKQCLLDKEIKIECPVRLIQGMKDTEVPWQKAHRISKAITGTDKEVYLRENGDHRLSTPDDLELLGKIVKNLGA